MKEYKIIAPEGLKIDEKALKEGKIEFIKEEVKLPQSWEELGTIKGWWIDQHSRIQSRPKDYTMQATSFSKNVLPTKELVEAMLALCQLLQLRDRYNDGWVPDWSDNTLKYCISSRENEIKIDNYYASNRILAFKTELLRNKFYNAPEIRKLIEIAKPLL